MIPQYRTTSNPEYRHNIEKSWSNQDGVQEKQKDFVKSNIFASNYVEQETQMYRLKFEIN